MKGPVGRGLMRGFVVRVPGLVCERSLRAAGPLTISHAGYSLMDQACEVNEEFASIVWDVTWEVVTTCPHTRVKPPAD